MICEDAGFWEKKNLGSRRSELVSGELLRSDSIPGMSALDSSSVVPPSVAHVIHVSVSKEARFCWAGLRVRRGRGDWR